MKRLLIVLLTCSVAFANISTTTTKQTHTTNGSAYEFDFSFPIVETSDLIVILRTTSTGAESVLAETTDYTVSTTNNDYSNGGTVTTAQTYASGYTLVLMRDTPDTQEAFLVDAGVLRLGAVENALDKLTMLVQQHQESLNRALLMPRSETGTFELPDSVARAGYNLGFDSTGDPEITAAATSISSTNEMDILRVSEQPWVDITHSDYGAIADDGLDDTTAFQAAIDAVNSAGGGFVLVPEGTYNVTELITHLSGSPICIKGAGKKASKIEISTNTGVFDLRVNHDAIEDISIVGSGPTVTGNLIYMYGVNFGRISRIFCQYGAILLKMENCTTCTVEESHFYTGSTAAVHLKGKCNFNLFRHLHADGVAKVFYLEGVTTGSNYRGNRFEFINSNGNVPVFYFEDRIEPCSFASIYDDKERGLFQFASIDRLNCIQRFDGRDYGKFADPNSTPRGVKEQIAPEYWRNLNMVTSPVKGVVHHYTQDVTHTGHASYGNWVPNPDTRFHGYWYGYSENGTEQVAAGSATAVYARKNIPWAVQGSLGVQSGLFIDNARWGDASTYCRVAPHGRTEADWNGGPNKHIFPEPYQQYLVFAYVRCGSGADAPSTVKINLTEAYTTTALKSKDYMKADVSYNTDYQPVFDFADASTLTTNQTVVPSIYVAGAAGTAFIRDIKFLDMRAVNLYTAQRIIDANDAGGAQFELPVAHLPFAAILIDTYIIPDTTLTGADTDTCTLAFVWKDTDGTGTTTITSTDFTSGTNATALVKTSIGGSTPWEPKNGKQKLACNDVITIKKTEGGSGLATPRMIAGLTYMVLP